MIIYRLSWHLSIFNGSCKYGFDVILERAEVFSHLGLLRLKLFLHLRLMRFNFSVHLSLHCVNLVSHLLLLSLIGGFLIGLRNILLRELFVDFLIYILQHFVHLAAQEIELNIEGVLSLSVKSSLGLKSFGFQNFFWPAAGCLSSILNRLDKRVNFCFKFLLHRALAVFDLSDVFVHVCS